LSSRNTKPRGKVIEIDIGLTKVVSVKLDLSMLKEIDDTYREYDYKSRSEFIREAIQVYMKLLRRFGRNGIRKLVNGVSGADEQLSNEN